jgi:MATE family multidrug resistance protein
MREIWRKWWHGPSGGREVISVAGPLMVSTLSWTMMQFIDRMFLFQHSDTELAAALPAALVNFAVLCFFFGVATYTSTFVAQYHGAGAHERVGLVTWQGVWVGVIATPFFLATIPLAPWLFDRVGHQQNVREAEVIYYQILCACATAQVIGNGLGAFFIGLARVRVLMVVDILMALINIVLDYALIFGKWGAPELGITGAAWATVIAIWFKPIALLAWMSHSSYRHKYGVWSGCRLDWALFLRLFRYGFPSGLQILLDVSSFTIFLLLIGRIGELELTASNVALNLNSLAFMPDYGIHLAAVSLVGQRLGENRPDLANRATWSAFLIALAYTLILAFIYLFLPDLLLHLHGVQEELSEQNMSHVRSLTIVILQFVAGYCLLDMTYTIFASAIKGAGDIRFMLWSTLAFAPIPAVGTWIGIKFFDFGVLWGWTMVTAWLFTLGIAYFARFLGGKWQEMRVIEPALAEEAA